MATNKYTGQHLAAGQWVNLDSIFRVGFAGNPARVVEIKPKSVVVEEAHRNRQTGEVELHQSKNKRITSITFVSDTIEEAESMLAASRAFVDSEIKIERCLMAAAGLRKDSAIAHALAHNCEVK